MANAALHRYWITFTRSSQPSVLNLGCGVTAFTEEDARRLLAQEIFPNFGPREVLNVVEDVDVSTLDEGHVLPNIGIVSDRGIWFPRR
jgi:hypothetical protein